MMIAAAGSMLFDQKMIFDKKTSIIRKID